MKRILRPSSFALRPSSFPKFRGLRLLIGVPALFVAAYFYPLIPVLGTMDTCSVRHFLGVSCPGCGLTRSFIDLVHGRFRDSVDAHPLGIVIAGFFLYQFGRSIITLVSKRPCGALLMQGRRDFLLWIFLVALIVQWVARLLL